MLLEHINGPGDIRKPRPNGHLYSKWDSKASLTF